MEKVKIQYIVNGKEFTSEKEAKKYANKLNMNPKYNEGDLVYIKDANGLLRQIKIIEAVKIFGRTHYKCVGYPKNVDELNIYPTIETYLDEIKNNVKYLSQE